MIQCLGKMTRKSVHSHYRHNFLKTFLLYVSGCSSCMCICVSCMCSARGGQKRLSHPLELELWMVYYPPYRYWKLNLDPLQEQHVLLTTKLPFQPLQTQGFFSPSIFDVCVVESVDVGPGGTESQVCIKEEDPWSYRWTRVCCTWLLLSPYFSFLEQELMPTRCSPS